MQNEALAILLHLIDVLFIPLALKQEGVKVVACGRLHTLVLSKTGRLYTFGAGGEGQLGHGDLEGSELPKLVQSLSEHNIVKMACGTDHSFILTGKD